MATTSVQFKTLNQLVQIQMDYVAANVPATLSTPLGPFITAIIYAAALVGLVLQRIIQLVLAAARLTTAQNEDVDSFVLDFGLSRLPGNPATGDVTLGKFVNANSSIVIPLNTIVQTASTPPTRFQVVADTSKPGWNGLINAYQLLSGQTSVAVKVQAQESGVGGNVQAGQINTIASTLSGIDTVTNGATFLNGVDIETDDQLKARFALYILGLSKATRVAVASAIENVQQGLIYAIIDPTSAGTGPPPAAGNFTVTVDDGSGAPTASLITEVTAAVDAVRPIGVRAIVTGPVGIDRIFVSAAVTYDGKITPSAIALRTIIKNTLLNYINSLSVNVAADFSVLYRVIWGALSPGDTINTEIAIGLISTTTVLRVLTTSGMQVGQVISVAGVTTASGVFPLIRSVDSDTQVTIDTPFTTVPMIGAIIETFSSTAKQLLDIHQVQLGVIPQTTLLNVFNALSTSTVVVVTPTTGVANGQFVNVDGFQTDPNGPKMGGPPTVVSFVLNAAIVLSDAIGTINAAGIWTPVAVGTNPIPIGTKVCTSIGGIVDMTIAQSRVARTALQQISVGMVKK